MVEFLRVLLLIAAGVALFGLGRLAWSGDPRMRMVVLAGFLGRAFVSQVLFWISFLSLPIAPSLQSGNGLWFYAVDAVFYSTEAGKAADGGLDAIAAIPVTSPSPTYQQALAVFSLLFGHPVAVSLLLNLFCYLGACAIIVRWSATAPASRNAALVALAAISLSPAGVLWSLQPLKDTFFQFLIVAFFGACVLWQRAWRAERMGSQLLWAGAALVASHYLLSGVRWYVGGFVFGTAALFMLLVPLTALRNRRWLATGAAMVLLLIISRTYLFAAGPYLPPAVSNVLRFRAAGTPIGSALLTTADRVRGGFERTGGNTSFHPAQTRPVPEPAPPASVAVHTPPAPVQNVPPVKPEPVKPQPSVTPKPEPPAPATASATPAPPPKPAPVPVNVAEKPVTPAPVPQPAAQPPAPQPAAQPPAPQPAVVAEQAEQADLAPVAEATRLQKLVAGAAAAALPRGIATRLGLIHVGAGRHNLWWFVELDTIFFDILVLLALGIVIANARGRVYRNPVFWLIVAVTVLNGLAVVYTVTNFGTLFRLRLMIFTTLTLIPLALLTAPAPAAARPAATRVLTPAPRLTPKENEG